MSEKVQPSQSTRFRGSDKIDRHWGDALFVEDDQGGLTINAQPKAKYGGRLEGFTAIPPLVDENGSADMAINVSFGGTPDKIHDGIDTVAWTASAILGTWVFDSSTHAKQGVITVIDYSALALATITIEGTNLTNTVLIEEADWTAETSNDVTAANIQAAVDAVEGVSASVSGSVVTIIADNSTTQADITTLSTDAAAGEMTASAQSIDTTATKDDDEALLKRSSTIDMTGYTAISLAIYLTKWDTTKDNEISIRARLAGVDVGNEVNLSEKISESSLNVWQEIGLNKEIFGLDTDIIDEFVIKTISSATGSPNAPKAYIDKFQIEETGSPKTFSFVPPAGTQFHFRKEEVSFQVNSALAALDPNQFITLPRLPIGVVSILTKDGNAAVATALRDNFDMQMSVGSTRDMDVTYTGSKVWGKIVYDIGEGSEYGALILRSSQGDRLDVTISDDLSGLTQFQIRLVGQLVAEI
jgi:hypothetical protein